MKILESHIVPELETRIRLSDYIRDQFSIVPSRKGMKKMIQKGRVFIRRKPAKTGDWIYGGEQIDLIAGHEKLISPENMNTLEVHYQDEHLAIIEKPSGIPMHRSKNSVLRLLRSTLEINQLNDHPDFFHPVHRLDRGTSGLIIISRTHKASILLSEMLSKRLIVKNYLAICKGNLDYEGVFSYSIDKKESITDVYPLACSRGKTRLNLVRLTALTGRRHQLRIHLAKLNCPILGDSQYGDQFSTVRLMLHAYSLKFMHPFTEKTIKIISKPSRKFQKFFPDFEFVE